jgi:hypothetical protein
MFYRLHRPRGLPYSEVSLLQCVRISRNTEVRAVLRYNWTRKHEISTLVLVNIAGAIETKEVPVRNT